MQLCIVMHACNLPGNQYIYPALRPCTVEPTLVVTKVGWTPQYCGLMAIVPTNSQ